MVANLAVLQADEPDALFCHPCNVLILGSRLLMVMSHKIKCLTLS